MNKSFISGFAVGMMVLTGVVAVYARAGRQAPDVVSMPEHWVPYTATEVVRSPHGDMVARIYRNSRGSKATYFTPDDWGPITIHNAETELTYARLRPDYWVEYPLQGPIPQLPPTEAKYRHDSVRLLTETVAGLPVYEIMATRMDSGHTKIVPGLNGLIVQSLDGNGYGAEVLNLVIEEPDRSLFLPPAGARVTRMDKPPSAPSAGPQPSRNPH